MKPRNMQQVLRSFTEALELLNYARNEGRREVRGEIESSGSAAAQRTAGLDEDKGTLSEREFEAALKCCKRQFHEHFMENEELKEWYSWFRLRPDELSKKTKRVDAQTFPDSISYLGYETRWQLRFFYGCLRTWNFCAGTAT